MHDPALGQDNTKTPDGRFGTACYDDPSWARELCQIPFARLLATPERFNGRLIAVTGYLRSVNGVLMLFPNRESFDAFAVVERVVIQGDIAADIQRDAQGGLWPVVCVGVFDARYTGTQLPALGALHDVQSVVKVKPNPWE
jgi:hypothetical protein